MYKKTRRQGPPGSSYLQVLSCPGDELTPGNSYCGFWASAVPPPTLPDFCLLHRVLEENQEDELEKKGGGEIT